MDTSFGQRKFESLINFECKKKDSGPKKINVEEQTKYRDRSWVSAPSSKTASWSNK
jgi:hypothetical protein